jgi:type IV secretory pathway protease TraF
VPLRARWTASRPAFEAAVDEAMADADGSSSESRPIGLYHVTSTSRHGDAVIFTERTGAYEDNAGFAYLPDGPVPVLEDEAMDGTVFRHLDGRWYSWTASW